MSVKLIGKKGKGRGRGRQRRISQRRTGGSLTQKKGRRRSLTAEKGTSTEKNSSPGAREHTDRNKKKGSYFHNPET